MKTRSDPHQPGPTPSGRSLGGELRVLVVDDDPVRTETIRECLISIGGKAAVLSSCKDAATALERAMGEHLDVLLVDYDVVETSGLEALQRLTKAGCQAPTVLLNGRPGEGFLQEALRAGAVDYLPQGQLSPAWLQHTIRRVLEQADLRERNERRRVELQDTVAKLRTRSEELESFYQNVSHELRTPLSGVREFVSLMKDGAAGPLTSSQECLLAAAVRSCDQLAHCVNDMLDVARIETHKLTLTVKRHDLVVVVRDAVESLRTSANTKGVEIHLQNMGSPIEGSFDPHRVYQVAANLTSNAIKFTPPGGVVSVGIHVLPGRGLQVRVEDSGPGISKGDESRIFDRLYQSSAKDAAILGGLGMGLYISQQIVRSHGGEIVYDRSSLGGAQFTFALPQAASPVAEARELDHDVLIPARTPS